jgi:hypothetical protein
LPGVSNNALERRMEPDRISKARNEGLRLACDAAVAPAMGDAHDELSEAAVRERRGLVGGVDGSWRLDGLGQAAADGSEDKGRHGAFGRDGQVSGFAGKLGAFVQTHADFAEELGGKAHVFGAINAPEPQFLFVALQEVQRLFELLHGAIE